ncbi:MAG: hypothetical protein M3219_00595 [Thermoproteota archaeon]|nr:hypothetical protein [Thermoproteota archaeon]
MSTDEKDRDSAKLKEAASLLTKGGTLISEPCDLCSGVQVKFRNKVTCINCGNEKSPFGKSDSRQQDVQELRREDPVALASDIDGSKSLNKHFRRRTGQTVHSSRQGLAEVKPDAQRRHENQEALLKRESLEQGSLQHASFLLIEKITSEIAKIKEEEENDIETLRRDAKKISIFLRLLKKVKEIERL